MRPLFIEFAERVRALDLEPGLVTHNPVTLADLLGGEMGRLAAVVSPCNPKGYKMVPDRAACTSRRG